MGFRDEFAKYTALGVKVFGVSYDSVADNNKFAVKHDLPFLLLSDSKRELAIKLGLAKNSGAWFAPRISYILDGEGMVLEVIDVKNAGSHAKDTLQLLDATQ
ncbi:MAG TPA: redoxin domain-containing protein [Planctomycetes bacterium]|nr:redoxin domain-containing protein [Planctomycetota bacterium]